MRDVYLRGLVLERKRSRLGIGETPNTQPNISNGVLGLGRLRMAVAKKTRRASNPRSLEAVREEKKKAAGRSDDSRFDTRIKMPSTMSGFIACV